MQFTKTLNEFNYKGIVWNAYTTPEIIRRCESFEFLPTDICVCTFPRSGTTLTQEIVWHIANKDTIVKGEKYADIDERFPFLEYNTKFDGKDSNPYYIDILEEQKQQRERLIKTHCPLSLIGEQLRAARPRIITVARNPKDCCISLFKFYKGLEMYGPWCGDLSEFVQMFLSGATMCGDYFQVVADWWNMRNDENVLFLKYEEILKNPSATIKQIATHLGRELSEEQLDIIISNSSFKSMYHNENVNYKFSTGFTFLRKGIIGDWKSQLSAEQSQAIDAAVAEKFHPIGLQFDYE